MASIREQVPDLPSLLSRVRQRPGMWLGRKSIHGLGTMLDGIDLAEDFHEIPSDARLGGFDRVAFEVWVERRKNPQRLALRSFGLAAHLAGSDSDGFDLWFRWHDEFLDAWVGRVC